MISSAWCWAVLTATEGMPGRDAASLIASASVRSFLARLTNGLTYCAGIRRTSWPSRAKTRPQWCAPPHASMITSVLSSLAKKGLHLRPPKVTPQHWTLRVIHAVQRENVL